MGLQAVGPASVFVTGDTDAAPQSASFYIRNRQQQSEKNPIDKRKTD